ncbi:hypothetical protein AAEX28_07670 [Lentisphaerota bacterium WC36G]|nr:hypothetical protein LJT99_10530 [Lentisphaerae bacterium WC36]
MAKIPAEVEKVRLFPPTKDIDDYELNIHIFIKVKNISDMIFIVIIMNVARGCKRSL